VIKGPDRSKFLLRKVQAGEDVSYNEETYVIDEVKEYLDGRYICDKDSCWRVFGYEIHQHYHAVEKMMVHLSNENYITYHPTTNMASSSI
jgi:hypothetical protein